MVILGQSVRVAVGTVAPRAAHSQQARLLLAGETTRVVLLPLRRDLRDLELLGLGQDGLRLHVVLVAAGAEIEREGVSVEFLALVAEGLHLGNCDGGYTII